MTVLSNSNEKSPRPRVLLTVLGILTALFGSALIVREVGIREFEYFLLHDDQRDPVEIQTRLRILNLMLASQATSDRMIRHLSSKDHRDQFMALSYIMATKDRRAIPAIIEVIHNPKKLAKFELMRPRFYVTSTPGLTRTNRLVR